MMTRLFLLPVLLFYGMYCTGQANLSRPLPVTRSKKVVIAHRGDHTHAPENTLKAYRHAKKAGADYVEVDLRTTKDSQLIIMHDNDLFRMTGLSQKVSETDYATIRQLTVRDTNHPEWGTDKVPDFEEVLQYCKGRIHIYLDFKNASVQQSWQLIRKYGMEKQVVVYINSPKQFQDWRTIAPEVPLMISMPANTTVATLPELLAKFDADIFDGGYDEYDQALVTELHSLGKTVWPDIQSSHEGPEEWSRALALGFDGLQTDHPGELVRFLKMRRKVN